ncbi:MAG: hypothetical protein IJH63_10545 [Methanobrevibacter sp.]|nr:hypothetical protein [Methanosphaera sp.]MBR0371139.1 hypothetical protein [Methanobrevibacter sp.]
MFSCRLSQHEHDILDTLENPSPETLRELSYNLSEDFNKVLDQLHQLLLDSYVKNYLNLFQMEFYNTLEYFLNKHDNNEGIGGFLVIFKESIPYNFQYCNKYFTVSTLKELQCFMSVLNISFTLLNDALQEDNVEFLFEAYYNLYFKLYFWFDFKIK